MQLKLEPYRKRLNDVLSLATLFFVCFPFIFPIMKSDLQPCGLFFGLIFFVCNECERIRRGVLEITLPMLFIVFIVIYAFIVSWATGGFSVRSLGNYLSVFVFCYAGYHFSKKPSRLIDILLVVSLVWLLVGIVQYFYDSRFLSVMLSRISTSSDRGVVSLAPEPSIYGIQCLLMIAAVHLFQSQDRCRWKVLAIKWILYLQVFLLARSTMSIVLAVIFIGLSIIAKGGLRRNLWSSSILGLSFWAFLRTQDGGSRLHKLADGLINDPFYQFFADQSLNQRFADIFMSFFSFFHQLPLSFGHGTSNWNLFFNFYVIDFSYLWFYNADATRIMSGFGAAVFELGWFGFFFPFITLWVFLKTEKIEFYVVGFFLSVTMISSVPLAMPFYGFLLGLAERARINRSVNAIEHT